MKTAVSYNSVLERVSSTEYRTVTLFWRFIKSRNVSCYRNGLYPNLEICEQVRYVNLQKFYWKLKQKTQINLSPAVQ